jgi:hypothetical protein
MEDGDSTKPPHESKRRPPKRRRKFTRSVRARPNASTADDIDAISDAAAARDPIVEPEHRGHGEQIQESLVANPIQAAVTSSAASQKLSNSELQAELKRKYKDLQDAHRTMASQSTTISSLSRRNKVLSEGTQKARASLREERDEIGLSEDQIKTFEADCWQHLRNVWFGAVSNALENELREILHDDLKELPAIYRIDLGIEDLCRCVEKVFGLNANYAKGYGSEFEPWANEYHEGVYLYPLTRACGGTRRYCPPENKHKMLINFILFTAPAKTCYYFSFAPWSKRVSEIWYLFYAPWS